MQEDVQGDGWRISRSNSRPWRRTRSRRPHKIEVAIARLVRHLPRGGRRHRSVRGPVALERNVDSFLDRFDAVIEPVWRPIHQDNIAEEVSGYPSAKPDKLARTIGLKECIQPRNNTERCSYVCQGSFRRCWQTSDGPLG